jgi:hypothetical protein
MKASWSILSYVQEGHGLLQRASAAMQHLLWQASGQQICYSETILLYHPMPGRGAVCSATQTYKGLSDALAHPSHAASLYWVRTF